MVTATRRAQPLTQAPSAITVITAEEIRQSGATSIPELLRSVPGLDFFRLSADDVRIAARGLNREFPVRMQVLLDGLSIQEDVRGLVSWYDIPVPLEEIERIEIVRSPATALYGDRAFAGVVHIITKSPEALKGTQVSMTVGEADTLIYNGIHAGALRNFNKPFDREDFLRRLGRYSFTTKVRVTPVQILLIDDDPGAVEMLAGILEPVGFRICKAYGG